jgi:hypothetical protein
MRLPWGGAKRATITRSQNGILTLFLTVNIYHPYVCKSLGQGSHGKKCIFNHLVGFNDVTCVQGLYPSSEPPNFLFGGPLGGGSLRLFKMATDGWKLVQDWNLRVFAIVLLLWFSY